ncbi:4Fe-4S dicluster domain-containing protein [bacterium]|nr:4Fe-4S dicluster domain-containing protein [bacterium]
MQTAFYLDQTRCTGCATCQVACKDWNDLPAWTEHWIRIDYIEKGICPNVFASYMLTPCYHCIEPACAKVCPTAAITKLAENGIVVVNGELCIGREACGEKCLKVCPYDVPQFEAGQNGKMRKCDFCLDRLQTGKGPICVESCPTRALDYGPMAELEQRYGSNQTAEGFEYSKRTQPAFLIKPKPVKIDA